MRFVTGAGDEVDVADAFATPPEGGAAGLATATVAGRGEVDRELSLPYHGQRLRGQDLLRRLDEWVERGVVEPSAAEAVRAVAAHPDWLDLADHRIVALGAGAEMGPVRSLLRWGADVIAVDLPRPPIWQRLLEATARSAGRLHVPVRRDGDDASLAERAGADLLHDPAAVADWLTAL